MLEETLVLRLEGGAEHYVPVVGRYASPAFGMPLEPLSARHGSQVGAIASTQRGFLLVDMSSVAVSSMVLLFVRYNQVAAVFAVVICTKYPDKAVPVFLKIQKLVAVPTVLGNDQSLRIAYVLSFLVPQQTRASFPMLASFVSSSACLVCLTRNSSFPCVVFSCTSER